MNCKNFIEQLDALLDGELTATEETSLNRHLGSCESCSSLYRKHRRLLERAATLARPVDPPTDLWPGIEARISNRSTESFAGVRAAAAAAVIGVATVVILSFQLPGIETGSPTQVADVDAQPLSRNDARARLVSKVGPDNLEYSPKTEAVLRKNIKVIQQAMLEIEAAIEEDPNNPNLRQLLLTIYQQESQLVDSTNRMKVQSAEGQGI